MRAPTQIRQQYQQIRLAGAQMHVARAQQRLQAAQGRLRDAERALEEAKQAYFRARAREDALEKRKHLWRDEQFALEARQEEDAAADLFMARYVTPGTS